MHLTFTSQVMQDDSFYMTTFPNCECLSHDCTYLSRYSSSGLGDLGLVDLDELTDEVNLHLDGVQVTHARFREVVALQDLDQLGAVRWDRCQRIICTSYNK